MPKYLYEASYTQQGVQGLLREGGSSRERTIKELASGLGGTIEAFYYAFGDTDVFVIADIPDDAKRLILGENALRILKISRS